MAIVELTEENLQIVADTDGILVLAFGAPWCEHSQAFAPVLEAAAEKYPDIVFARVNADEEKQLVGMFEVRSVPTVMVFREQLVVHATLGVLTSTALDEILEKTRRADMKVLRARISQQLLKVELDGEDERGADMH